ncbi:RNA polymerase factor sigma-54 [Paracoccaceae bacterium Fryx2]|nr:RNA polymerase factor sigma-54 [Paracoccaceae bacterium Fryx2]
MDIRTAFQTRQSRSLAMTAQLRHAINLLRFDNQALAGHLILLARANPCINVTLVQSGARNWLDDALAQTAPLPGEATPALPASGRMTGNGADAAHQAAAPPDGLLRHVFSQISLLLRDPADHRVAHAFAEALEPSGWLSCGPAEIARACGCTPDHATAVLGRLQQIEPAGLFARSLAECLRLQAADLGVLTPDFACLLENLPDLARGDLTRLMHRCGCDSDRLQQMVRVLRGMNPKPGTAFDGMPPPITEPDLVVNRGPKGWLVALNRSTLPAIEVREMPGADAAKLREARWLQRTVSRRNATTLRIAEAVVSRQGDFLAHGPARIRPLSFADVAGMIDMHQSTVSRVTSGLLVATPRGTLRFREFFSAARAATGPGPGVATGSILHALKVLIAAEDPHDPLRDIDIARHFQGNGIALARRTVAKYRGQLRIPSASGRKMPQNRTR